MATLKFLFASYIFATMLTLAVKGAPDTPVQPPGGDCMNLIYDMVDCLPYLSAGGYETKPEPSCCTGLAEVVVADVACICEALKSSAALGIEIDMDKAVALPSACDVSTPPLSSCDISSAPSASPANPYPGTAPSPVSGEQVDGSGARASAYSSLLFDIAVVIFTLFYVLA